MRQFSLIICLGYEIPRWGNKLFLKHIYSRESDLQKGRLIFFERENDNAAFHKQFRVLKNLHYPTLYVPQSFFSAACYHDKKQLYKKKQTPPPNRKNPLDKGEYTLV